MPIKRERKRHAGQQQLRMRQQRLRTWKKIHRNRAIARKRTRQQTAHRPPEWRSKSGRKAKRQWPATFAGGEAPDSPSTDWAAGPTDRSTGGRVSAGMESNSLGSRHSAIRCARRAGREQNSRAGDAKRKPESAGALRKRAQSVCSSLPGLKRTALPGGMLTS